MARAFLYPVLKQKNVTVLVNTQVNRVLFNRRTRRRRRLRSGRANSLLRRNRRDHSVGRGIQHAQTSHAQWHREQGGPDRAQHPRRVHSPEVGKNVQDHILHGGCLYESPEPFEYRNSAANVSGYYKSDAGLELPDVSIVQIELPFASDVIAAQYNPRPNHLGPVRRARRA